MRVTGLVIGSNGAYSRLPSRYLAFAFVFAWVTATAGGSSSIGAGANSSSSKRARLGPGGISIGAGGAAVMASTPLDHDRTVRRSGQSSVSRGTLGQPIRGSISTWSGQPKPGVTRNSATGGASMNPPVVRQHRNNRKDAELAAAPNSLRRVEDVSLSR